MRGGKGILKAGLDNSRSANPQPPRPLPGLRRLSSTPPPLAWFAQAFLNPPAPSPSLPSAGKPEEGEPEAIRNPVTVSLEAEEGGPGDAFARAALRRAGTASAFRRGRRSEAAQHFGARGDPHL